MPLLLLLVLAGGPLVPSEPSLVAALLVVAVAALLPRRALRGLLLPELLEGDAAPVRVVVRSAHPDQPGRPRPRAPGAHVHRSAR